MVHVDYDFVTTPQGAMASRKGNVIVYEDFRDLMFARALKNTKERHADWPEEKIQHAAFKISQAAMKFGMLKYENKSVIVFDMDAQLALEGATGPYLLYSVARINSILKKIGEVKLNGAIDYKLLKEKEERDLIKQLSKFTETVELCAKFYQPSF